MHNLFSFTLALLGLRLLYGYRVYKSLFIFSEKNAQIHDGYARDS